MVPNVPAVPIVQAVQVPTRYPKPEMAGHRSRKIFSSAELNCNDLNVLNILNDLNRAFSAFSRASKPSPDFRDGRSQSTSNPYRQNICHLAWECFRNEETIRRCRSASSPSH